MGGRPVNQRCAKHFPVITSLSPHNNPVNQVLLLILLDRGGNRGPEKVSNWPEATELVHSRAKIQTQTVWVRALRWKHCA